MAKMRKTLMMTSTMTIKMDPITRIDNSVVLDTLQGRINNPKEGREGISLDPMTEKMTYHSRERDLMPKNSPRNITSSYLGGNPDSRRLSRETMSMGYWID